MGETCKRTIGALNSVYFGMGNLHSGQFVPKLSVQERKNITSGWKILRHHVGDIGVTTFVG